MGLISSIFGFINNVTSTLSTLFGGSSKQKSSTVSKNIQSKEKRKEQRRSDSIPLFGSLDDVLFGSLTKRIHQPMSTIYPYESKKRPPKKEKVLSDVKDYVRKTVKQSLEKGGKADVGRATSIVKGAVETAKRRLEEEVELKKEWAEDYIGSMEPVKKRALKYKRCYEKTVEKLRRLANKIRQNPSKELIEKYNVLYKRAEKLAKKYNSVAEFYNNAMSYLEERYREEVRKIDLLKRNTDHYINYLINSYPYAVKEGIEEGEREADVSLGERFLLGFHKAVEDAKRTALENMRKANRGEPILGDEFMVETGGKALETIASVPALLTVPVEDVVRAVRGNPLRTPVVVGELVESAKDILGQHVSAVTTLEPEAIGEALSTDLAMYGAGGVLGRVGRAMLEMPREIEALRPVKELKRFDVVLGAELPRAIGKIEESVETSVKRIGGHLPRLEKVIEIEGKLEPPELIAKGGKGIFLKEPMYKEYRSETTRVGDTIVKKRSIKRLTLYEEDRARPIVVPEPVVVKPEVSEVLGIKQFENVFLKDREYLLERLKKLIERANKKEEKIKDIGVGKGGFRVFGYGKYSYGFDDRLMKTKKFEVLPLDDSALKRFKIFVRAERRTEKGPWIEGLKNYLRKVVMTNEEWEHYLKRFEEDAMKKAEVKYFRSTFIRTLEKIERSEEASVGKNIKGEAKEVTKRLEKLDSTVNLIEKKEGITPKKGTRPSEHTATSSKAAGSGNQLLELKTEQSMVNFERLGLEKVIEKTLREELKKVEKAFETNAKESVAKSRGLAFVPALNLAEKLASSVINKLDLAEVQVPRLKLKKLSLQKAGLKTTNLQLEKLSLKEVNIETNLNKLDKLGVSLPKLDIDIGPIEPIEFKFKKPRIRIKRKEESKKRRETKKSKKGGRTPRAKYTPSLAAIEFDITSKLKEMDVTGLKVRPVVRE